PAEVLGSPASGFVADFVGADRGLKRLAVTSIDTVDLEKPPVVGLDASLADARRSMDADGARWAVVLDAAGALHGYLSRDRAAGDLAARVEELWARRSELRVGDGDALAAVREAVGLLDSGEARVAEVDADGEVVVHQWLKQAILLLFKLSATDTVELGPFEYV